MTTTDQALHGTYRCPVCGHRDSADVRAAAPARAVTCSYCGTMLEVSARNADAMHFAAQIAARAPGLELHG